MKKENYQKKARKLERLRGYLEKLGFAYLEDEETSYRHTFVLNVDLENENHKGIGKVSVEDASISFRRPNISVQYHVKLEDKEEDKYREVARMNINNNVGNFGALMPDDIVYSLMEFVEKKMPKQWDELDDKCVKAKKFDTFHSTVVGFKRETGISLERYDSDENPRLLFPEEINHSMEMMDESVKVLLENKDFRNAVKKVNEYIDGLKALKKI